MILVNAAVWVYMLTLIDQRAALLAFYQRWAFDPAVQLAALFNGHLSTEALVPFISHQFLHAGWLHIGGNMLFLWVFGGAVEGRIGHLRFLVFYLFAGCVAALAQGLFQIAVFEPTPLVGASGAISGVLGAYLVSTPIARVRTLVPRQTTFGPLTASHGMPEPTSVGPCWFEPRAPHQTPRFDRDRLPPGLQIAGPAIVEDAWSTIVVPPGYVLRADAMGHLWINEVVA